MRDRKLRVAVTGAAGYIGSLLIESLQEHESIEYILATDIRSPRSAHNERVEFVRHDITEPFPTLFKQRHIDVVVHLAYILNPGHNPDLARQVNVVGTEHLLQACSIADIDHVVYFSSSSVYGAHPDNPDYLIEDDPVRPLSGFQYSENKAEAEAMLVEFSDRLPSASVTILRGCPVMGPHADNFIARALRKPVLPLIGDADPPMQFIHENDLVEVLVRCVETRPPGIYNLAGDGTIRWRQMARIMNRRMVRLPPIAWQVLTSIGWSLRLQNDSPSCGLCFIRYRWTVNTDKLKRELGVDLRHTSRQAWESFVESATEDRP